VTGKLGRRPPHPEATHPRLKLRGLLDYRTLPPIPDQVDYLSAIPNWPVFLNDRVGDCTCAAAGHMIEVWSRYGQGTTSVVSDADVLAAYEAVSGYTPTDPATDQGAVMQDVLDYWRTTGIGGHKILAFAQVDVTDLAEVYAALYLFGQVYVGVNIPQSAMDQFDNGQPWRWVSRDGGIVGGHAVNLGWRDGAALEVVTWGRVQALDEAWWRYYAEEAWVVVDAEWVSATGGSPEGLDVAALNAAFTDLTGQPGPLPVPAPVPPSPPSPTPPPGPDPADMQLVHDLRHWLAEHHTGDNRRAQHAVKAWMAAKGLGSAPSSGQLVPPALHSLRIRCADGFTADIEMDGRPLYASRLTLDMAVDQVVEATVTLPGVEVDSETMAALTASALTAYLGPQEPDPAADRTTTPRVA
jgi:hypothetical protein